jgi:hypothetical protein
VIADFHRGQDHIQYEADAPDIGGGSLVGFSDLDTNHNGVLDGGDEHVRVEQARHGGRSELSTVIDASDMTGHPDTLTVFGVTGLTVHDFSDIG